jgi:hypothetical protein
MRLWRWAMMKPGRFQLSGRIGKALLRACGGRNISALKPWTEYRELPPAPPASFREMWRKHEAR